MIPLGLKETKEIDFREPFKVSWSEMRTDYLHCLLCAGLQRNHNEE